MNLVLWIWKVGNFYLLVKFLIICCSLTKYEQRRGWYTKDTFVHLQTILKLCPDTVLPLAQYEDRWRQRRQDEKKIRWPFTIIFCAFFSVCKILGVSNNDHKLKNVILEKIYKRNDVISELENYCIRIWYITAVVFAFFPFTPSHSFPFTHIFLRLYLSVCSGNTKHKKEWWNYETERNYNKEKKKAKIIYVLCVANGQPQF